MRYDLAVLYSAIASELMLEKACQSILNTKHVLNEDQCETIIEKLRIPELFKLLHQLDPGFPINYRDVEEFFKLHNKIAHGVVQEVEWRSAKEAIDIGESTQGTK
jgi:hypothetical protein